MELVFWKTLWLVTALLGFSGWWCALWTQHKLRNVENELAKWERWMGEP